MQFICIGKDICAAITKLQRITANKAENVTITSAKNTIFLNVSVNSRKVVAKIQAVVAKSTTVKFTIAIDVLNGICKNRNALNFVIANNHLSAKEEKTNYRVDKIALLPDNEDLLDTSNLLEKSEDFPGTVIVSGIKACLIKSLFENVQLSLSFLLKDNSFIIAVADNFHGAMVIINLDKSAIKVLQTQKWDKGITLPLEYAELIANNFDAANLLIKSNSKVIKLHSPDIYVELPALQTNSIAINDIIELQRQCKKSGAVIEAKDLQTVIQNIHTVKTNNTAFTLKLNKHDPELQVLFQSTSGRVRDIVKIKKKSLPEKTLVLPIETNNCIDIVRKLEGAVSIYYNNNLCMFANKNENIKSYYFSFLLQEEKSSKR